MTQRLVACIAVLLLLTCSAARAQEDAGEAAQLQRLLAVINAELKSDLEQVLVLQEAIRANARMTLSTQWNSPDPVSFDAMAAAQRQAIQREAALNARIEAILARSATLDGRKQPLLDRLMELGVAPTNGAK